MLNNVEMPTIAFISMIKATCESLKAEQVFVFKAFYFMNSWKVHTLLSLS